MNRLVLGAAILAVVASPYFANGAETLSIDKKAPWVRPTSAPFPAANP